MSTKAPIQQPASSIVEIVAQVRFPSVLTISSAPPAAFQERVRSQYPVFGLSQDRQAYVFQSENRQWTLTLGSDFMAVVTPRDAGWDLFKTHLAGAMQALTEIYRPQFFSRVGLRLRHVIRRSAYGLAGQDWSQLLHPHLAATCAWPELGGDVQVSRGELVLGYKGKPDQTRIGHGLILIQGPQGENREVAYLLDHDLFVEARVGTGEVFKCLDGYYREAQRVFRLCLTDRLIRAMAPSAVVEEKAA